MKSKLFFSLLLAFSFFFFLARPSLAACVTNLQCNLDPDLEGCSLNPTDQRYYCSTSTPADVTCTTNGGEEGINTALGCIPYEGPGFVNTLLALAVGIGGTLALLLMLYGFFIITTSAGIPDKIKAGQEIITSAVVGLVFIVLSVVLMNFIGLNLFDLPGLQ